MLKNLFLLSTLVGTLAQEYGFIDNMVDFEEVPYQRISLPYPYQNDHERNVIKIHRISNDDDKNNNKYEVVELPAKLEKIKDNKEEETKESKTSLSTIDSSLVTKLCAVASNFFGIAKTALSQLIASAPALILGAVLMVGFCKITSVCTKISALQSLSEAQKEFNKFVTPERMDMATEFIQEAIRRYRSIQEHQI